METTLNLRKKQSLFVQLVAVLVSEANRLGYELTFGEAYRSAEEALRLAKLGKGIANSLHSLRLAIDLHAFKDGRFLSDTEDYRELGEAWEGLDPMCRWGGRFKRADGNHFSLEHEGRA